jgi:hypothetical protein
MNRRRGRSGLRNSLYLQDGTDLARGDLPLAKDDRTLGGAFMASCPTRNGLHPSRHSSSDSDLAVAAAVSSNGYLETVSESA